MNMKLNLHDAIRTTAVNVFSNNRLFQERAVSQSQLSKVIEIRDAARNVDMPEARAFCSVALDPQGYREIEMDFRRGIERCGVHVQILDSTTAGITHNGRDRELPIREGSDLVLFDGPGPMFDYANACLLMGMNDGEDQRITVNVIDLRSGAITPVPYMFSRRGVNIAIRKGFDCMTDSALTITPDKGRPARYRSGGYTYVFDTE